MNVATWNMQGASHGTEDKWNKGVQALLNMSGSLRPDAICLQEAGTVPASAKQEATSEFRGPGGRPVYVYIYSWGGTDRTARRLVYYWWDEGGNRCNLGVITRELVPFNSLEVGLNWAQAGPEWRPAVGLRAGTSPWVFSVHAISPGGADAPGLVNAVQSYARGRPWAVGGDFNREPNTFAVPNATVRPPNEPTYSVTNPVSRYDYLVQSGANNDPGTVVKQLVMSDHYPAAFGL
jgi:cytolethal distending toxin subunit B